MDKGKNSYTYIESHSLWGLVGLGLGGSGTQEPPNPLSYSLSLHSSSLSLPLLPMRGLAMAIGNSCACREETQPQNAVLLIVQKL
jgi:hypothetical protein